MKLATDEVALEAASAAAWRERYVLEVVLLKLETEETLAVSGKTRWLPHADRELKMVLEQVRLEELATAAAWQGVADAPGLSPAWTGVMAGHRHAIDGLLCEVATAADRRPEGPSAGDARRQVREWAWKRVVDAEIIDLSHRWEAQPED
jgi:hypothetical protein